MTAPGEIQPVFTNRGMSAFEPTQAIYPASQTTAAQQNRGLYKNLSYTFRSMR